jgi:hypothetical protein
MAEECGDHKTSEVRAGSNPNLRVPWRQQPSNKRTKETKSSEYTQRRRPAKRQTRLMRMHARKRRHPRMQVDAARHTEQPVYKEEVPAAVTT